MAVGWEVIAGLRSHASKHPTNPDLCSAINQRAKSCLISNSTARGHLSKRAGKLRLVIAIEHSQLLALELLHVTVLASGQFEARLFRELELDLGRWHVNAEVDGSVGRAPGIRCGCDGCHAVGFHVAVSAWCRWGGRWWRW